MESPNLIITSPHAKCDIISEERSCDYAAALAGKTLCAALDKYKLTYVYLPGDEFRRDWDLNRKVSRSTKYRTTLESIIKESATHSSMGHSLLVDVHSFPNNYMDAAGKINFFAKGEVAPDVVFLQSGRDLYNGGSLTDSLSSVVLKAGLKTKIIRGITVNDIMNNANEHSISAILIEFNEKYNKYPEKMAKLCQLIAKCIHNMSGS
jgi:hypothetical protein